MKGFVYVYILSSDSHPDSYYVGLTEDLYERLARHNRGEVVHTAKRQPWSIKNAFAFWDRSRAAKFERYLKSGAGRAFAKNHF